MALNGYSVEGRCLVWKVSVSDINLIRESPVFSFDGSNWRFELKIAWNNLCKEDLWTIKINKADPAKVCHKFQVRVQVENKSGEFQSLRVASIEFPSHSNQPLLEQTKSFLLRCYSNVIWDGNIKFIFTLYDNIFCTEDLERKCKSQIDFPLIPTDAEITPEPTKKDKLVQTSSFGNVLPCLESLSTDLQALMTCSSQHDVELQCRESTFSIHRSILCARSKVFKAMLGSELLENHTSSLLVVDMEISILKRFVLYLYTGILSELTVEVATQLYEAGVKYAVDSLKRRCSNFFKENIEQDNAYRILIIADAHNDTDLKDTVISFLLEKGINQEDDEWIEFCNNHSKMAIDILNRAYKVLRSDK